MHQFDVFHRSHATTYWAVKGGAGTTVLVAATALVVPPPVLVVDLDGDVPVVLGLEGAEGPGVHDWLASGAAPERLDDLLVPISAGVALLPAGTTRADAAPAERWEVLARALASRAGAVLVDAGSQPPPPALHRTTRSLVVARPTYQTIRRIAASLTRPAGVVLVDEPGHTYTPGAIADAAGAPVVARVSIDPAVARAVDTGLLRTRLPRVLSRQVRSAA